MNEITARGPARIDYRRVLRPLYSPGARPVLAEVPPLTYLMIDGRGDPNTAPEYAEAIQALFTVAYAAKFAARRAFGTDLAVMPLEGLWWAEDMSSFAAGDRTGWRWTAMIMQPAEITAELVGQAVTTAAAKAPERALSALRLERLEEGRCAQVGYTGPYSAEGPTIERLHAFIADQGLLRSGTHHEIYLSDPRRSAPERLRTVLRQPVRSR